MCCEEAYRRVISRLCNRIDCYIQFIQNDKCTKVIRWDYGNISCLTSSNANIFAKLSYIYYD